MRQLVHESKIRMEQIRKKKKKKNPDSKTTSHRGSVSAEQALTVWLRAVGLTDKKLESALAVCEEN